MQKLQINIIRTYLLITLLLVASGILFPTNQSLWLFRYFTILTLFLIAIFLKIKRRIRTLLPFSLLFAAIGDAFLYLNLPLKFLKLNIPLGLFSFAIAYIIIASVYFKALLKLKNSSAKHFYLVQLILLILIISIFIYFLQKTNMDHLIFGAVFVFALLLVFCAALNLFFSNLVPKRLRLLILISSTLMLICDTGVILGFSLPNLDPIVYNLGASIVWSAYIPAWTIICILSMDTEFSKIS